MRVPRVCRSVSDVCKWQNNYLNNSYTQYVWDASSTRIRQRVRRLHMANNYLYNCKPQVGGG